MPKTKTDKGRVIELRDERSGGDYDSHVAVVELPGGERATLVVAAGALKLGDLIEVPEPPISPSAT